jgi:hypothetical protein
MMLELENVRAPSRSKMRLLKELHAELGELHAQQKLPYKQRRNRLR